jgi:RNA polymerase sigma-70 factor (ECF subfamily)
MAEVLQLSDAWAPPIDEVDVIARAAAGDGRAFETLYRQHAPRVYGLCLRLTGGAAQAEDCAQEAFIAAWRALPTFAHRSRFSTWLHRIAVNTVLAGRRRRDADARTRDEEPAPEPTRGDGAEASLDFERAIARLPRGARDVFVLAALYGYSHEEVAELLGIAVGTSKAHLHRARQLLAQDMGISLESP